MGDAATNRVSDEVRRCEQAFLFPRLKYGGTGHADGRALLYDILDGVRGSLQEGTGAQLDPLLTEGITPGWVMQAFLDACQDIVPFFGAANHGLLAPARHSDSVARRREITASLRVTSFSGPRRRLAPVSWSSGRS